MPHVDRASALGIAKDHMRDAGDGIFIVTRAMPCSCLAQGLPPRLAADSWLVFLTSGDPIHPHRRMICVSGSTGEILFDGVPGGRQ